MIEQFKELTVKRNNDFYLDSMDYQILTMLYKPLVGPKAIDFYVSLYQLSYKDNPIKKSLIYIMDVVSDNSLKNDDIDIYIEHLSKIKLLKFDDGVFELFPNYEIKEFFNSPFISYLKGVTAKTHFKYLEERFIGKEMNVDSLGTSSLQELSKRIDYYKRKNDRIPFDFDSFILNLQIENKEEIKKERDFFISLSNVYNLSLDQMIAYYYEAENDTESIKESIIKIVHQKFLKNLEKANRKKMKDSSDSRYVVFLQKTSPEVILNMGSNRASESDRSIIVRLREEKKLNEELISMLIAYSLATNNKKMHPYVFYETVIEDWKKENITSAEDAYYYITKLYTKSNKEKKVTKETQSSESWFDDFWDKIKEGNK